MGLDMYLYAKKFVSNAEYRNEQDKFKTIVDSVGATSIAKDHLLVDVEVGYWRKANAIHNWFVGDREDDCRPIHVTYEQLNELLDTCKELNESKDTDLAEELLPPVAGFFFGSTEIDEWYWNAVEDTIKQLEHVLDNTDGSWAFEYCASW